MVSLQVASIILNQISIAQKMGCCCSSVVDSNDPSVQAQIQVRRYISQRGLATFRNDITGLLYTDGTNLYYDAGIGCCGCCKQSFPMSSISTIVFKKESDPFNMTFDGFPPPCMKVTGIDFVILTCSTSAKEMEEFVRYLEKTLPMSSPHLSQPPAVAY